MSTQSDESAATPSQADLLSLAGSVHTFESFGRAVVQAIIQASANQATQSAGVQATATIRPLGPHASPTFGGGVADKAAGEGAASPRPCLEIALDLGGSYPTTIKICP